MKQSRFIAVLAGAALLAASPFVCAGVGENEITPADQLKWVDGPVEGIKEAKLWGDRTKGGPWGSLIKFQAGHTNPLHHHPHDLRTVIVSGTFVFQPEGGKEQKLGAGSWLRQAGGKKHVSGCSKDADCVFLVTSSDKFDLIPAEKPAEAKKEEKKEAVKEEKKDAKK